MCAHNSNKNIVPDALSRLEVFASQITLASFKQWSTDQVADPELKKHPFRRHQNRTRAKILSTPEDTVYLDFSMIRVYVRIIHTSV
jgi:hypothetical protein